MTDTRGRSGGRGPTRGQNKQRRGRGGRAFGQRTRSELVHYLRGPERHKKRQRKRRIRAPAVADDPAAPQGVDRLTRELLHKPQSPGRGAHGSGWTNELVTHAGAPGAGGGGGIVGERRSPSCGAQRERKSKCDRDTGAYVCVTWVRVM
ncbi:hypothetical protein ACRRTK_019854 [Alexandromys fortis]